MTIEELYEKACAIHGENRETYIEVVQLEDEQRVNLKVGNTIIWTASQDGDSWQKAIIHKFK